MLWALIACLKACTQSLTLAIEAIERQPQGGKKDQLTQTDVSIPPACKRSMYKGVPTSPAPKAKFTNRTPASDAKASASSENQD